MGVTINGAVANKPDPLGLKFRTTDPIESPGAGLVYWKEISPGEHEMFARDPDSGGDIVQITDENGINAAAVDHDSLGGLPGADAHTQYALLAGRIGDQKFIGSLDPSGDLKLESTSDPLKGKTEILGQANITGSLGVGLSTTPLARLHVKTTNGNLGIFDTSTTAARLLKLQCSGANDLRLGTETVGGGSIVAGSLGNAGILVTRGALHLVSVDGNPNSNGITVDSSGRVGVQNTTPSTTLDVDGTITCNVLKTGDINMKSKDADLTVFEAKKAKIRYKDNETGKVYELLVKEILNA